MIIVVGAGLSGMACAARLAARGLDVTVLEASDTVGGAARAIRNGRYVFDFGPTLLTMPAVYRDLFLQTGTPLEDHVELVDVEDAFRFEFASGDVLRLPGAGVGRWASAIGEQFGSPAAEQWRTFSAAAATAWSASRASFLETARAGRIPLTLTSLRTWRQVAPRRSLRALTSALLTDPRLRLVAEHSTVFTGCDPRRAPAALAVIPYLLQTFGVHHISGGVSNLAAALHTRCLTLGVTFEFSAPVTAVIGDPHVTGVEVSGSEYHPCDALVWGADTTQSAGARSWSQFTVFQALTGRSHGLAHHNVWFNDDTDGELDALHAGRLAPRPTLYVCEPEDDRMRPGDSEARRIATPAARHDVLDGLNWRSAAAGYARSLDAELARRGQSAAHRAIWQEVASPADYGDVLGNRDGALSGPAYVGMRSALRRDQLDRRRNMFHVGGHAHPGPGIPLAGMGARTVASLVAAQQVASKP